MNESEIKIKLFQEIDALGNDKLIELLGIINNFLNNKDDMEEWNTLSSQQKKGINYGISELDKNKGIEHNLVMEELRKKYGIS